MTALDCSLNRGPIHVSSFLPAEECAKLTAFLVDAAALGLGQKDEQCKLSDAFYAVPAFDELLEQKRQHIEKLIGRPLHPTYSYARLYANGEELKPHLDRSACEVSVTMTIGHSGASWPIFMAKIGDEGEDGVRVLVDRHGDILRVADEREYSINTGDAVVYSGTEHPHWRERFLGEWQAQVFLHYVFADGPNRHLRFDGRPRLAHEKPTDCLFWFFESAFSNEFCDALSANAESQGAFEAGVVGYGSDEKQDISIRDVARLPIPAHSELAQGLLEFGASANRQAWGFDVSGSDQTELLKYEVDGHYSHHIDVNIAPSISSARKLTILLFLNDDFVGGRFFIQAGPEKIYPPQRKGSVLVFPSFLLHGVEPVTSGTRRTVVSWLCGPWFR